MSFPRYPKYKDSSVEWLGEVPEHWQPTRLGYLCSRIGSGKTPKGGAEVYVNEGVPLIRSQNVHDDGLRLDDVVYIDAVIDKEMIATRVRPGDILLNITGASLGRTCLVPEAFENANVNQHVCVLRLSQSEQRRFIALGMKSSFIKAQIDECQNGAAREGLNFEQIGKIKLYLPPPSEQLAIVSFLDREIIKIDALVAEQQRLIELLKEKRQAVISHAVTKGLNPNVRLKPSGIEWLGDVPEHWEVVRLKFLCDLVTGDKDTENAEVDGEYPFFVRSQTVERINTWSADCEAVLTAGDGVGVGKVFHYYIGPFDFHQRVYMMSNFRKVSGKYFFYFLRENFFKVALEGGAKSTVDSLRRPMLANFWTCVPPPKEQLAIVVHLERVTAEFELLSAEAQRTIELLRERRAAILSAAITGKIDVREPLHIC